MSKETGNGIMSLSSSENTLKDMLELPVPAPSDQYPELLSDDGRKLRPRQETNYDEQGYISEESPIKALRCHEVMEDNAVFAMNFDESLTDMDEEHSIMIGAEYQAEVPDVLSKEGIQRAEQDYDDTSICTWVPPDEVSEEKVDKYMRAALEIGGNNCQYTIEQVLGILYSSDYRAKAALKLLREFSPESDGWTFEEKVVFEQALDKHGKNFKRIVQDLFPEKPVGCIIKRYYERKAWTKSKNKKETKPSASAPVQENSTDPEQSKAPAGPSIAIATTHVKLKTIELTPKIRHGLLQKVQKLLWEKRVSEPMAIITID